MPDDSFETNPYNCPKRTWILLSTEKSLPPVLRAVKILGPNVVTHFGKLKRHSRDKFSVSNTNSFVCWKLVGSDEPLTLAEICRMASINPDKHGSYT